MAKRAPRTGRPRLSRERIVEAAVVLVDRDGIDALSMRTLAAHMGVGTMSLYNHVASKDEVLDGVAEAVLGQMDLSKTGSGSWEDRARALAMAFRQVALAHPQSFALVLTRRFESAMSIRPMERSLEVLRDAGFHGEIAVSVLRAFMAFEFGSLMRELHSAPLEQAAPSGRRVPVDERRPDSEQGRQSSVERWEKSEFPRVAELAPLLNTWDHAAEYEFGVELMISAVRHLRSRDTETRTSTAKSRKSKGARSR